MRGDYGTALSASLLPGPEVPVPEVALRGRGRTSVLRRRQARRRRPRLLRGSGTTAHAVMRLNKQDGGRRQSIMVTNNEVSADEATALRVRGPPPRRPGVGGARASASTSRNRGSRRRSPDGRRTGEPIEGDYKFTDEFPMADGFEENVEFFELTYQTPDGRARPRLRRHRAAAVAAGRWSRARDRGVPRLPGNALPVRLDGPLRGAVRHRPMERVRRRAARVGDARPFIVTDSTTTFAGSSRRAAWPPRHGAAVRARISRCSPSTWARLMKYELLDYQREAAIERPQAARAGA